MVGTNLRVAREALELLRDGGFVDLKYLTAEFEPFSSGDRPDVVFVPNVGSNAGRVFVVELRLTLPSSGRMPPVLALAEHRRFIQEDLDGRYMFFAVATAVAVAPDVRAALAIEGVHVLEGIAGGKALALALLRWVDEVAVPPWVPET